MPMKRWIWWRFIAVTMSRVPSTRGRPVAFRLMSGPRVLMTACPHRTASSTAAGSVMAPKTVTFTRRLPLWLLWWWRGGRRGRCHRRAGRWTPRFISYDTDRSATTGGGPAWRTSRSRSGYPYGELAPGVLGCERMECFVCLLELVGLLDGNPERPGFEQSREPL